MSGSGAGAGARGPRRARDRLCHFQTGVLARGGSRVERGAAAALRPRWRRDCATRPPGRALPHAFVKSSDVSVCHCCCPSTFVRGNASSVFALVFDEFNFSLENGLGLTIFVLILVTEPTFVFVCWIEFRLN